MVVITLIITTTLKYPDALGYAQMIQSTQNGALPGVNDPTPPSRARGVQFDV